MSSWSTRPLANIFRADDESLGTSQNEWQGDDLSYDKHSQQIRIMFHNVNGLPIKGPEGLDMFINEQINLQVDLQGIAEHCLDTTKVSVLQVAQETLRRQYKGQTLLQMNSSSESALHTYKPGGTGIVVLGSLAGRLEPNGRGGDQMGRWSYIQIRRRQSTPITIITAYQVCPRPTNHLGNTAYHQQVRALNSSGRHNVHPREAFMHDLNQFITKIISQGHDILLGGDFNEALEDKKSGILKLITRHHLTDVFLHRFPQHQQFGTHVFGNRRIDSAYATPGLLHSISKIGYAPFQYAKPSDHRPLLLELDAHVLFGNRPEKLRPSYERILHSKDKTAVTRYIESWYAEIQARQGFHYTHQIQNDEAPPELVEMVDEIIGKSSDIAEQACRRRRPEFYSHQIVQQRCRVSILRSHLNAIRHGLDRTKQLEQRMKRAGLEFDLPPTQKYTLQALQLARVELHHTCQDHKAVRHAELEAKIDHATQQGNKPRAKVLKAIRKVESNLRT